MEESALCLGSSRSLFALSELCNKADDDKMEHVEADKLLEGDSLGQGKNKNKKKKHKGGLQSPRRILAFNMLELSKLDENKAEMKKCATLSKSASFPINVVLKNNRPVVECSGNTKDSKVYASSASPHEEIPILERVASLPLKSALRGGYEERGIGPRPKLQVKWAPGIREPPCSTVSHTVTKNYSKKKDTKQRCEGKSNRNDSRKKLDKNKPLKVKSESCSTNIRRLGDTASGNHKELISHSSSLELKETDGRDVNGEVLGTEVAVVGPTLVLERALVGGGQYPIEPTCGGSLYESKRVSCNLFYTEAM